MVAPGTRVWRTARNAQRGNTGALRGAMPDRPRPLPPSVRHFVVGLGKCDAGSRSPLPPLSLRRFVVGLGDAQGDSSYGSSGGLGCGAQGDIIGCAFSARVCVTTDLDRAAHVAGVETWLLI